MMHTPGPWKARDTDNGIEVDPVCDAINATYNRDHEKMVLEARANAALIAAAPDLLAALKTVVAKWDSIPEDVQVPDEINDDDDWQWDQARAALEKVKGEA